MSLKLTKHNTIGTSSKRSHKYSSSLKLNSSKSKSKSPSLKLQKAKKTKKRKGILGLYGGKTCKKYY